MTGRTKQEQSVITNLVDAGCNNEQIEQFMSVLEQGREKKDWPSSQSSRSS